MGTKKPRNKTHLSQWPRCSIHLASIQTATTWARCGTIFLQFRAASWQRCCWIVLRYTQKGGALQEGLHFRNRFQTMPCILYRVLQHTAATSHIEKPNTLSGRRVVHERQMRRATYWHNRGSNLVDYTFCVLILPCLYFSGDTRHEIQKGLNPCNARSSGIKWPHPFWTTTSVCSNWVGSFTMVDDMGIEPTTSALRTLRSPSWANRPYRRHASYVPHFVK